MAAKLVYLPTTTSADTIRALEYFLELARAGEGIGFAGILQCINRKSILDVAGTAKSDPQRARGMLADLDDELSRLSRGNHG